MALLLTIALLALGALLGGCGSVSPARIADPVARAAFLSSQEKGVRFTMSVRLSSSLLPRSFAITGSGYSAQDGHSVKMTMNFSGIPGATGLPSGGRDVEAIYDYPTVYLRMPFLADKLPEGKEWLQIDMSKVAEAAHGAQLPQALGIGQVDPAQLLQYLRASSGQVRRLGSQEVNGVSTTHYGVTLKLADVLARLPSDERAAARPLLQHVGNSRGIPIGVWIDGRGRVRRVEVSLDIAGATASGSATVRADFTEYGPVPAISPPPGGEVVDLTSLLSNGLTGTFAG